MPVTFTHLVFDGVADGPVGVALDIVGAAARLAGSGHTRLPQQCVPPRQRIVSVDGQPVRTAAGRSLPVDGAFSLRNLRAGDALLLPGLGTATPSEIGQALARPDIAHGV